MTKTAKTARLLTLENTLAQFRQEKEELDTAIPYHERLIAELKTELEPATNLARKIEDGLHSA